MTFLGVFRDDFYNATAVLSQCQVNAVTGTTSFTVPAQDIAAAQENYINATPTNAVTYTTDTAVNIIAALQNAIAVALKANLAGGSGFASGVNPPAGIPNLFNVAVFVQINNLSGNLITMAAGTGVTLGSGSNNVAANTSRSYVLTITSPTTVTLQTTGSGQN